jgi:hypothetical protein
MPTSSRATAIPAPMVPAPITAAWSSGRTGVDGVMPSTLPAARSAKKACLSPFDSGVAISSWKACRSMARPSSNGFPAAWIASTARKGAGSMGRFVVSVARAASHRAARLGSWSGMSRVLRGGLVVTSAEAANSTAPASGSPSTTRSSRAVSARAAASTGSPVTIMSIAFSTPTSRGSRWVPPAPGRRPSLTSGRPSFPSALATR